MQRRTRVFADGLEEALHGSQTIGRCRKALEYHTRATMTVNASFKGSMKLPRFPGETRPLFESCGTDLLGIGRETLRYGPPRPRPRPREGG